MTLPLAAGFGAILGAVTSFGCARLLLARGAMAGLVDPPGERKLQARPVPLIGGISLLIGWLAGGVAASALAGALRVGSDWWRPSSAHALALCFLVGLADDLSGKRMSAAQKAIATLAVLLAVAATHAGGLTARLAWTVPVAFAALHSMNTIDHEDGLLGLVAGGAAAAVAVAAVASDRAGLAALAAAAAGAIGGFLALNLGRRRVFLGDGGSLLLGAGVAALYLRDGRGEVLWLAAVPLADLASVAWIRISLRVPPWVGDRRHVTHRLMARGIPARRAVLALGALQAGCSAFAGLRLARPATPDPGWFDLALSLAGIGLLALGMLGVAPPSPACPPADEGGEGERG